MWLCPVRLLLRAGGHVEGMGVRGGGRPGHGRVPASGHEGGLSNGYLADSAATPLMTTINCNIVTISGGFAVPIIVLSMFLVHKLLLAWSVHNLIADELCSWLD